LLPDTAERIDGTEVHTVPLRELSVDNIVVVRPGTRVPADGTVVDGQGTASVGLVSSEFRAYATEATACVSTRRSAQSRPSETGILSVVKLLVTNQPSSFGQARRRHIKMN
jgi:high-affinity K+ transport system ATPase subunit B